MRGMDGKPRAKRAPHALYRIVRSDPAEKKLVIDGLTLDCANALREKLIKEHPGHDYVVEPCNR